MTATRRRILYVLAALAAVVLITAAAGILVLRSAWFYEQVRLRMIQEIEKASGGKTEVGSFHFDWRTMTARVDNFVLHGKEKPGEPVFLRAQSVMVGLKVISAFQRQVDIATGIIEKPELHLIVYDDGTTNMPQPAVKTDGNFADSILRLKVRHYEVRQGTVEFKERRIPLDIRGDNLVAKLDYDPAHDHYTGHISSRQLHIETREILPLIADFDTDLVFERRGLRLAKTTLQWPHSRVEMSGALEDFNALHGGFDVRSRLSLAELGAVLRVPIEHRGEVDFNGHVDVVFAPTFSYHLKGAMAARNLGARFNGVEVAPVAVSADTDLSPAGIRLDQVNASLLGGAFRGSVSVPDFQRVSLKGQVSGLALSRLAAFGTGKTLPWSGTVGGTVEMSASLAAGARDMTASAGMEISRAEGGIPVEGVIDAVYNQRAGTVELGSSRISTPDSRLVVSGTLGRTLDVQARTTNLNDLLPALRLVSEEVPEPLPVKLASGGSVLVNARVQGPLNDPKIAGTLEASHFIAADREFDHLTTGFEAEASRLAASNLTLAQNGTRVTGSGTIALAAWKAVDASALSANLALHDLDVAKVLKEAGATVEVTGTASATIHLQGTYGNPTAAVQLTVLKPAAYGEQLDRYQADVRYSSNRIEVVSSAGHLGNARLELSGVYQRTGADWTNGRVQFKASSTGLRLEQINHARLEEKSFGGEVTFKAGGSGDIQNKEFVITAIDGEAAVRTLTLGGSRFGNASVTAKTANRAISVQVSGNLRNSRITGSGQWKIEGDYPGRGELQFSPISFGTLQRVAEAGGERRELPFQGRMEGRVVLNGPLRKPDELKAEVTLPSIEFSPAPDQRPRGGAQSQELVLRNTSPVSLTATTKTVEIHSARFAAKETSLEATGRVTFDAKSPWDLKVKGDMNLAILQLFNADLLARGNAVLNAGVTGPLKDPQVNGRLELRRASLYLSDITTGVDNANGVVTFDRNRATIERLTAEVGGGRVGFTGFIGFNAGLLLYRVQATADQVRIRYPEGVSTTLTAQLNLTGTSASSLVSGTVTVVRAGFTPRADLGSLLASTAKPVTVPTTPNEYLRNIQLDIRIESGPSLEFQTSLTRDLQAEIDLRLRGNVARPALLGVVSVNEGEVNVFGTKYSINRGEVRFLNPTRIEPVFDVDLETKARGITVNISFSGTLTKMNLTYRSDPPLQTSEIIALIAVGRDPNTSAGLAGSQVTQNSFLDAGTNALGSALTAPVTSRLQRFFGVSRLKIDPQLTGVENIPQARLTLEQQISKDITLTYITNLARTQEQIYRIQWDISKEWSAIAVREENGVFGIDFQYRKRFK